MKKEGKIARRTIITIFLVVCVLIVSICLSVGLQIKNVLMDRYRSAALSYAIAASNYIDGDTIEKYYTTGKTDEYYDTVNDYLTTTADSTVIKDNDDGLQILCLYVLIPNKEDYTYIWDAEPGVEPEEFLSKYPYSEGADVQAQKFVNKEITEDVQFYYDNKEKKDMLTVSVPLHNSNGDVVALVAIDSDVSDINRALNKTTIGVIVSIIIIMLITMVAYYYSTKKLIINPIVKLHDATEDMVENLEKDRDVEIDIHTNDEIEMLAHSFENMNVKLREYIRQNETITAEKERIGAELGLATRIQADMLPNIFPAFPERSDFDIYASMTPAKEVGGDFYDFFLVDETHLAVVMADVSGKGVPAALFMMMSKILIQNAAMNGLSPAKALEAVNSQICANNREEMFVTVWLGIIDLKNGVVKAANAGHEKPIIKNPDGDFEFFKDKHGFIIGGMEGVKYKDYEIRLEKGSKLFIYTDGVVEATNKNDELFGIDRTLKALNSVKNKSPMDILTGVKEWVDEFVGSAPKFDDLTMLCFEYIGKNEKFEEELTFDATLENVSSAVEFVGEKAQHLPLSTKECYQIEVAVDEIVCNIARYAYGEDEKGTASIAVGREKNAMVITVSDSGIPYNPLEKDDPDVTLSADERGVGGYGIFIVKKVMDEVIYEYKDNKNILIMKKYFSK